MLKNSKFYEFARANFDSPLDCTTEDATKNIALNRVSFEVWRATNGAHIETYLSIKEWKTFVSLPLR